MMWIGFERMAIVAVCVLCAWAAAGEAPEPAIHGPRVVGATPGRPFLFLIPATGEGPLKFAARDLPAGLSVNPDTGIISGTIEKPGTAKVVLEAEGPKGKTQRVLAVVAGDRCLALTPPMGWNSWNIWARQVDAMPEDTLEQVRAKQAAYAGYVGADEYRARKLEYDLWTAAFFWKIDAGDKKDISILAPTHGELMRVRRGEPVSTHLIQQVRVLAERVRFLHWELEFPEVFAAGGFSCALGNPPWERIKLQEEEFFAARDPQIATAANKAARQKLIDALAKNNPALADELELAKHAAEAQSKFTRASGRYPLTAVGDMNTYALFAELSRQLICPMGRVGILVPTGIATDDTTKDFFADLTDKHALASLYDFENRAGLFPAVDSRMKFCTLTLSGAPVGQGEFVFFATQVEHLRDPRRRFALTPEDISLFNPNSRTMPVFRARADVELTRQIYRRVPVLINDELATNTWWVKLQRVFDMSHPKVVSVTQMTDSLLLRGHAVGNLGCFYDDKGDKWLPVYEGKMFTAYNHRSASVEMRLENINRAAQSVMITDEQLFDPNFMPTPAFWMPIYALKDAVPEGCVNKWTVAYKDIAANTNERTMIAAILPHPSCNFTIRCAFFDLSKIETALASCFLANLNALVFDYSARQSLAGLHLSDYIVKQLPFLSPGVYTPADRQYIVPRVVELTYTAYDLKPFAEDMGYHGEPFRWDEDRRALLRAELDAYYARLYGLTRDELRYILDPKDVYGPDFPGETFRVLKEKEERLYGEYRTRRLVLEAWDRMFG